MPPEIKRSSNSLFQSVWDLFRQKRYDEALKEVEKMPQTGDYFLAKAKCFCEKGEYQKAMAQIKLIDNPNASAILCKARIEQGFGNYQKAWDLLNTNSLNKNPTIEILMAKARLCEDWGKNEQAEVFFKKIPGVKGLFGLARLKQKQRIYSEAVQIFQQALGLEENEELSIGLAYCYDEMKQHHKSLLIYEKLLRDNPKKDTLLLGKARCLVETGQVSKALPILSQIHDPDLVPKVLFNQARCAHILKDFNQAFSILKSIPATKDIIFNKVVKIEQARCHQDLGEFEKALDIYNQLLPKKGSFLEHDTTALLAKAHCLIAMSNYSDALNILIPMVQFKENKYVLLAMARCYQKLKNYPMALSTYEEIKNWQQDDEALIGRGRTYQYMKEFNLAIDSYNDIPDLFNKANAITSFIRCLIEQGNFSEALNLYNRVPNPSLELRLTKAICYEQMGQFENALKIYNSIPVDEQNIEVLLSWGQCLEAMGEYNKAIILFKKIEHTTKGAISLGRCYGKNKDYEKMVDTFEAIPNLNNNKEALIAYARTVDEFGKYAEALAIYRRYPNWKQDTKILQSIARCHEENKIYTEAIATYNLIKASHSLDLAICYHKWGQGEKAMASFKNALIEDPYDPNVMFYYINFLLAQNHPEAQNKLAESIQKWPHFAKFYVLHYELQIQKEESSETALNTLNKLIKDFPYFHDGYLVLIKHYLSEGKKEEAQKIADQCKEQFKGHHLLFNRITYFFENIQFGDHSYFYESKLCQGNISGLIVEEKTEPESILRPEVASTVSHSPEIKEDISKTVRSPTEPINQWNKPISILKRPKQQPLKNEIKNELVIRPEEQKEEKEFKTKEVIGPKTIPLPLQAAYRVHETPMHYPSQAIAYQPQLAYPMTQMAFPPQFASPIPITIPAAHPTPYFYPEPVAYPFQPYQLPQTSYSMPDASIFPQGFVPPFAYPMQQVSYLSQIPIQTTAFYAPMPVNPNYFLNYPDPLISTLGARQVISEGYQAGIFRTLSCGNQTQRRREQIVQPVKKNTVSQHGSAPPKQVSNNACTKNPGFFGKKHHKGSKNQIKTQNINPR